MTAIPPATVPGTPSEAGVPTVLRVAAEQLDAALTGPGRQDGYRAVLTGPAGAGTHRIVTIAGSGDPHDLIVVDYGDSPGYSRAWLRGGESVEGTLYTLLAELPASFPARAPGLIR